MVDHYDGYCFDKTGRTRVFSTFSVNSFLSDLGLSRDVVFGDYWYQAGGVPSVLSNYLSSPELNVEQLISSELEIPYDDFVNPT